MKVLLIQPPYPFSEFPKPSSALMSIGAVLREMGMEVNLLDLLSRRYSIKKIESSLERFKPDIVGTTCVTMNFPSAVSIIKDCKRIMPEIKTIMGGPHVTFTSMDTLLNFPEVDIIVRGEGEETIRELVYLLENGGDPEKIKGLTLRHNGKIIQTEDRPFIRDLDALPLPARDLFPLSRYLAMRVPASVITSRGCPVGCAFCVGYRMMGTKGRFRNPKKVVDEIECALRMGFQEICIDDDLFTRNRAHVIAICDEIEKRDLQMTLYIFARVDTVDELLLRKLKKAGCAMICYGLESGNQRILDMVKKGITLEGIRKAIKLTKDAGISPLGSFILGLPGETKDSMEETMAFARSLGIPFGFHILSPFPGTRIRERAQEYGIKILTDDWSIYDADHAVTETEDLSAEEVEIFARSFFNKLQEEIEYMKKRTLYGTYDGPYRAEMEKRLEVDFVWKLLSEDILESQGVISKDEISKRGGRDDPLDLLSERITGAISLPRSFVETKLKRLIQNGLISIQMRDDLYIFKWRDE